MKTSASWRQRLACVWLLGLALPAWSAVWRVEPGGDIQAVVTQAAAGDVVEVARGFYSVNLRIDKPLTLRGINRPTLSGGQRGDGFEGLAAVQHGLFLACFTTIAASRVRTRAPACARTCMN